MVATTSNQAAKGKRPDAKKKQGAVKAAKQRRVTPRGGAVRKGIDEKKFLKEIGVPSVQDLFKTGFHFGHTTSRWNPKMKPYIYAVKKGIHIIDLGKTHEMLKSFMVELYRYASKGSVLVVGSKKQATRVVKEVGQESGFFYVAEKWPAGLLTNFSEVRKSITSMLDLEEKLAYGMLDRTKKEVLELKKELQRKLKHYEGVRFMGKLPSAIVVIDSKNERVAVKEARKMGVKVFAMLDTNCDPTLVDYFVSANDDAIKAIRLFVELIGKVVKKTQHASRLVDKRKVYSDKLEALKVKGEQEREAKRKQEEEKTKRLKELKQAQSAKGSKITREDKKAKKVEKKVVNKKGKSNALDIKSYGFTASEEKVVKTFGVKTEEDLQGIKKSDLVALKGVGEKTAEKILSKIKKAK